MMNTELTLSVRWPGFLRARASRLFVEQIRQGLAMAGVIIGTIAVTLGTSASSFAQTTAPTGSSQSFNRLQPGLAMQHVIATVGNFPSEFGEHPDSVATVHLHAAPSPAYAQPSLQGQLLPITGNQALFSLIGTLYGGTGETDFGMPDLRGRFTVGAGTPAWGGPPLQHGQGFGNSLTQLTLATLPTHRHSVSPDNHRTTYTGSGEAINLFSPSMPMTYIIATQGNPPSSLSFPMIGMIRAFAGSFAPGGWLPADGRLLNIVGNEPLYQVIGTLYGGDGTTNFALPDLRGKVAVGVGPGAGLNLGLGETTGTTAISLGVPELTLHTHALAGGGSTMNTGSSQAFLNLQPSLGIKYLIATQGQFPSFDSGSFNSTIPTLGEVIAFAGSSIPAKSVECAGQLLPINTNPGLFSMLGTTYGGNGTIDFAVPDLRGRAPVGVGNGLIAGQTVGAALTKLTISTMTTHTHEEGFKDGFE